MAEHSEAVEYDLLTKTGHELRDVGDTLSWGALASFVLQREAGSALARDIDGDLALWSTTTKTNGLLADIFDILAQINANIVAIGEHGKARTPAKYPRPGMTDEPSDNERHIGKGAMERSKLRQWFDKKRRERNGERA